jgi:hypothetical protein
VTIGDLLFALGIDGSRLEQDVTKEAQKAGDAGAKTLSQRLSAGLKGAGMKALAGTFSAAAAAATTGALQMEDAVARIRSETGASQQQAEEIAKASNQIAGDQQQSLAAVTDVAIAIKKNMGATGEQLNQLTDSTVKFARVTKQDGVGAVKAMDDIVDAWGISLGDVTTVQDQLIASNQKFGGSITENQDALARMAPQLKALGASIDDGIGLLNLFAASGLDSSKTVVALNTAVTKLKPGQTLNDLIAQVSAIQDPTLRAKKAIELFGAKGGTALANVLKPGINGLADFKVSAQDAAGATNKAVDDLDSSLGGRLRKVLSQAKAALRGFGADFGPAVTAAASVGSLAAALGFKIPLGPFKKLGKSAGGAIKSGLVSAFASTEIGTRLETLGLKAQTYWIKGLIKKDAIGFAIGDALDAVKNNGKVQAASDGVGKFLGSAMGKAFSVAFAAVAIVELAQKYDELKAQLDSQARDLTSQTTAFVTTATRQQLEAQLKTVQDARARLAGMVSSSGPLLPVTAFLIGGQTDELAKQEAAIKAQLDAIANGATAAGEHAGKDLMEGATAGATAAAPKAAASIGNTLAKEFTSHGKAWIASAHAAGNRAMEAVAQGIDAARQKPLDAFDQLKEMLKHELTPMAEQSRLLGELTSKALARGLRSKDPEVKAQARATKQFIIDRLTELATQTGRLSKKQASMLAQGLKSKDPDIRHAAQHISDIVSGRLEATVPKAHAAGVNAGDAFANGVRSAIAARMQAGINIHVNPIYANNGKGNAVGGWATAGVPTWVNEHTTNSEIFVPSTSGRFVTHAEAMNAIGQGGASPINITINAGGDVSPVAAHRFGQLVVHEVAAAFRQGGARRGISTSVRP